MCLAFFPQSAVDDNGYVPLVNAKDRLHHKHDQKTPLRMSEISLKTQLLLEKMMLLIISKRNEVFFFFELHFALKMHLETPKPSWSLGAIGLKLRAKSFTIKWMDLISSKRIRVWRHNAHHQMERGIAEAEKAFTSYSIKEISFMDSSCYTLDMCLGCSSVQCTTQKRVVRSILIQNSNRSIWPYNQVIKT